MKKLSYFIVIALILFAGLQVKISAQKYEVDKAPTVIRWEGANLMRSHNGTITIKSGELELKSGVPAGAVIVVDMSSIADLDIENEENRLRLENHLKSDDFFAVEKHPEAVFQLKEAVNNNGGASLFRGTITIKGITNPVEFTVNFSREGNGFVFTGHMEIDRSLYDVRYGSGRFFDNLGDRAINDLFTLDFELHFVK